MSELNRWGPRLLCVPALVWGAWLSWKQAFVCDDAFISFRYARNLLEGHGLVFNRGEWVEGYTNFLWVLEVAALWVLGVEPATGALALSAVASVATVAVVAAWVRTDAPLEDREWLLVAAVWLLVTERSFAVWASGGLATRQFTVLLVAALALLPRGGLRATAGASGLLGLAALTRPEAYLWAAVALGLAAVDRWRSRTLDARMLGALALPFVVPVALHLLWRRWTYGLWVPNTYVAKHVAPWIDMGLQYLGAATIEAGLWLIVPLALAGFVLRARRSGHLAELAGPLAAGLHLVFVVRVGGDHFEWRPLDPWWPLLAVGAATALVALARRLAAARAPLVTTALLALTLLYGRAVEIAHDRQVFDAWARGRRPPLHVPVTAATAPVVARIPGLGAMLPAYDRWMADCIEHGNAIRQHRHRSFAESQLEMFGPYLAVRDALELPPDLVVSRGSVGIMPYHLPDLEVIDALGLTDAVVARNPVKRKRRHMAHDRRPPEGYLRERGVNAHLGPAARGIVQGLADYDCAVRVGDGLWLTLTPTDLDQALTWFEGRAFGCHAEDSDEPAGNRVVLPEGDWVGAQLVGTFEPGWQGWQAVEGRRFGRVRGTLPGQEDVHGMVGERLVNSFSRDEGDGARLHLRSPPFEIPDGGLLTLRIGGGHRDTVAAVLVLDDGTEVHRWPGRRSEMLAWRRLDLSEHAGRTAWVELVDDDTGPWGHVLLDHVVLYAPR